MQCIARRTRNRETLSETTESDARSRLCAAAPPTPPDSVIVIGDEEESTKLREIQKESSLKNDFEDRSSKTRNRSRSVFKKGDEESGSSSDRKAVVVGSDPGGEGSEGTVEDRVGSKSDSVDEKSGSSGCSESSIRFVKCEGQESLGGESEAFDAGGEREALKFSNLMEKPGSRGSLESAGNEEEVEETDEDGRDSEAFEAPKVCNLMKRSACVARRTRIQVGKHNRVSYTEFFQEEVSDTSEEEEEEEEEEDEQEEEEEKDESYRETDNAEAGNSEATSIEGEKGDNYEVLLKRKFSGIDILVSVSNEKTDTEAAVSSGSIGIALRTRSRFNSMPDEEKKLGTVSNPFCLDVDELETEPDLGLSSFDGEDEMEGEGGIGMNVDGTEEGNRVGNGVRGGNRMDVDQREEGNDVDNGIKGGSRMDVDGREEGTGQEGARAGASKKRKRLQASKANSLFKILVDTIWHDTEKLPEELVKDESHMEGGSASCHKDMLPPVFSFGDEDPKPVEKSEYEKALDELWADFDFALESNNIGTYHSDEGQTDKINVPKDESDPSTFCSKGEHQFILNEQIGITCKFCSFVEQEIRHILPSWASHFGERSARKTNVNEEGSLIFNDLSTTVEDDGLRGSCGLLRGTVWDFIPGIDKTMYQHQREAFEFMWRNLAGSISLNELKSCVSYDGIGGCVISHAPGTGKTRLAIVFIQTYMKVFPKCRPVIVAPKGMLHTWKREFKKWDVNLSIHDLNAPEYSGEEDDAVLKLIGKEHRDMKWMRLVKLYSWDKGNSILLVSYCLFKMLTVDCSDNDLCGAQLSKILLEKPGLFIFDEGHTPRNENSLIWKALHKVRASQRIILSGTPFQNNFTELYNTLRLVRPTFAEKISTKTSKLCERKTEFFSDKEEAIFPERNEGKGKWASLTNCITDDNCDSLEELQSIIKPFVHVHNGNILDTLPGLRECVIILNPPPQQKSILEKIEDIRSTAALENDYKISLASIHPSLLTCVGLSEKENSLIDMHLLKELRLNPNEGVKTKFLTELIRLCEALNERVLVFSQYIKPLEMIRDQLVKLFNWTDGKEVLQMNGKILPKHRQSSIDRFNDLTSEARVLLASTKACCEGISLVGASRVVLIDIVWNPSVERQAISRAYRIGQGKIVYIYHLITSGTGERDKYSKQAKKDHLSKLVFSPEIDFNNIKANSSHAEEERTSKLVAEDKILEEMTGHDKLKDIFIQIYYPPK